MDLKTNPLILLVGVILYSIASSFLAGWEIIALFSITITVSLIMGTNVLSLLWKMKVMLFTALLILLFGFIGGKDTLTVLSDTLRFLALITVAALFVLKADLLELSSSLGKVLSSLIGKTGWKISSYIMLSLSIFPLVFESADEMLTARRSRSGSFFSHPVRNLTEYTISLMRLLFEKILIFQDALYSRSFTIKGEKTVCPPGGRDYLILLFFVLLFAGVTVWKKML